MRGIVLGHQLSLAVNFYVCTEEEHVYSMLICVHVCVVCGMLYVSVYIHVCVKCVFVCMHVYVYVGVVCVVCSVHACVGMQLA